MSYRNKFNASKDQAHNQNIATKILKDLGELRETIDQETSNSRRWIWELIQNAKDVAREGGVTIKITRKKNDDFWFCHDGKPFKADNIRYLVEQISTKDQEDENENGKRKTTGKFGTGFLTTHLLCEKVIVHGVLKEDDEPYKKFQVELDRTGYTNKEIIESVKESRKILDQVDELPDLDNYDPEEMNTKFQYPIADDIGVKIMREGVADLRANIGYSLSVSDDIKVVSIGGGRNKIYKTEKVIPLGLFGEIGKIIEVVTEKKDEPNKYNHYAVLKKNFTSIMIPIKVDGDEYSLLEREENVPSLFCEFPLIGSESFSFPAVINNPNFNPTEPRDGVTLVGVNPSRPNPNSVENKKFIAEAIELYEVFAQYVTEEEWGNLHLLARINSSTPHADWMNRDYFDNTVVNGVRNVIRKKNIFKASDGSLTALFDDSDSPYALIPRISKYSLRDKLWEHGTTAFSNKLPMKEHIPFWAKYGWSKCGKFDSLFMCKFIEQSKHVETLEEAVEVNDIYDWLNAFYLLLEEDTSNYDHLVNHYKIFPDQNNMFYKKGALKPQEGEINEIFKNILAELGDDIRREILHKEITFEINGDSSISEDDLVRRINGIVPEKANDRETAKKYRTAFNLLLKYFRDEEKDAKLRFKTIYINKYMLFDEDVMIANTEKIEELESIIEEYNLESISDIKALLSERSTREENSRELLPITSEIISSLGIANLEEWEEAMKDKNLAAMFDHASVTSRDMFVRAAAYIDQAKESIVNHLSSLEGYDTIDHYFTANTILGGVEKDGIPIDIVCRPAYKNEVIIYYESERAVLREAGELWIDSAKGVERITLGRILDKAQIRKFPV